MKTIGIKAYKVTATGTAARIQSSASGKRFSQNAIIYADAGNTQNVYIGGSDVDATHGFPIVAGSAVSIGDLFLGQARTEVDLYNCWCQSVSGSQTLWILVDDTVTE